jgi:hypothetical protein
MSKLPPKEATGSSTSSRDPQLSASTSTGASASTGNMPTARTLEAVGVDLAVHLSSGSATAASAWSGESATAGCRSVGGDIGSASRTSAESASGGTTSRLGVGHAGTRGSDGCYLCRRLDGAAEGIGVHDSALLAEHGSRCSRWRLGLFCTLACKCDRGLLLALFVQQTLSVSEFTIFTTDNISQLLEALAADVEALSRVGLGRIVAEEDESFECGGGVQLLVDAPKDVVEERLKSHMHTSAAGVLGLGFATRGWFGG